MTREEYIKFANALKNNYTIDFDKLPEFCDMAISALSAKPCDDCISREAVLEIIDGWYEQNRDTENIEDLIVFITYMDSARPQEPKTGHWIDAKVGKLFPSNDFKCSECGNILDFNGVNCGRGDANYCPNCGAKMKGGE